MSSRTQRSAEAESYRAWYKTARWQRLRAQQLRTEPLCRMCKAQDRVTIATVCDHIDQHNGDPIKFWSGPFQSLCKPHHDSTKQSIERKGFDSSVGEDGWPTDAKHPANRVKKSLK